MPTELETASSLPRVMACLPSHFLPHRRQLTIYGSEGNALHEFILDSEKMDRVSALTKVPPEFRERAEMIDLEALRPEWMKRSIPYFREVAVGWNSANAKAKIFGYNIGRGYPKVKPTTFKGTADLVGYDKPNGIVFIEDYKFGRGFVAKAADNWQLKFLALACATVYGADEAFITIRKVSEDGENWPDTAHLDKQELRTIGKEMKRLAGRLLGPAPTPIVPVTGPHCSYCEALPQCPAHLSMVREMVSIDRDEFIAALTPEVVAKYYPRLRVYQATYYAIKDAFDAYAMQAFQEGHPIEIRDGVILGIKEGGKELVKDHELALAEIAKISPELALAASAPHTTKGDIKAACKKRGVDVDVVLDQLRAAGAIAKSESTKIEEIELEGAF